MKLLTFFLVCFLMKRRCRLNKSKRQTVSAALPLRGRARRVDKVDTPQSSKSQNVELLGNVNMGTCREYYYLFVLYRAAVAGGQLKLLLYTPARWGIIVGDKTLFFCLMDDDLEAKTMCGTFCQSGTWGPLKDPSSRCAWVDRSWASNLISGSLKFN